jgi:lipopolysaccharide/colanic/teichoic acid biosynthesis glycosyltransferase
MTVSNHIAVRQAAESQVRRTPYVRFGKRATDVVVGSTLLVLAAPVLALAALLLRMSLGAGIVLRQERVGRGGTTFTMYKFRTMHPSRRDPRRPGHHDPERRFTHKHPMDPRHTPIGRLFRRTSLDELPQLFHVVGGTMSLVGPRPELSSVVDAHALRDHPRHQVRPGLTGPWQVTRRADHVPLHECVDDDIDYVADITLRGDVEIMLRTIGAVVRGTGS